MEVKRNKAETGRRSRADSRAGGAWPCDFFKQKPALRAYLFARNSIFPEVGRQSLISPTPDRPLHRRFQASLSSIDWLHRRFSSFLLGCTWLTPRFIFPQPVQLSPPQLMS